QKNAMQALCAFTYSGYQARSQDLLRRGKGIPTKAACQQCFPLEELKCRTLWKGSNQQPFPNTRFLMLGLIYFLIQVGSYGLNFWAPHLIRATGVDDAKVIGLLTAVPYVFGAITMITVGRLSDRSGGRRKYVAALLVLASIGFLGSGIFDKNPLLLVLSLGVMGAGVIAAIPAFWALPPMILTGATAAGGIALINTLGQFGGIVSPLLVSSVLEVSGSTTPALFMISATSLLCAFILMFGLPKSLHE
ncbi:MFS transporter, partial [Pseudomonas helleri]